MYPKPTLGPGLCECGCGMTALKRFAHGHSAHNGPAEFWRRLPRDHADTNACWLWPGPFHERGGYGAWGALKVHRLAYEIAHGPIPADMHVCHHCDNPPCCNPHHLFLGTRTDNMRDMAAKGRSGITATITFEDAEAIRWRYGNGDITQRALACEYGIGQSQVNRIIHGTRWRIDHAA